MFSFVQLFRTITLILYASSFFFIEDTFEKMKCLCMWTFYGNFTEGAFSFPYVLTVWEKNAVDGKFFILRI